MVTCLFLYSHFLLPQLQLSNISLLLFFNLYIPVLPFSSQFASLARDGHLVPDYFILMTLSPKTTSTVAPLFFRRNLRLGIFQEHNTHNSKITTLTTAQHQPLLNEVIWRGTLDTELRWPFDMAPGNPLTQDYGKADTGFSMQPWAGWGTEEATLQPWAELCQCTIL